MQGRQQGPTRGSMDPSSMNRNLLDYREYQSSTSWEDLLAEEVRDKRPWKKVALAVFLCLLGTILLTIGLVVWYKTPVDGLGGSLARPMCAWTLQQQLCSCCTRAALMLGWALAISTVTTSMSNNAYVHFIKHMTCQDASVLPCSCSHRVHLTAGCTSCCCSCCSCSHCPAGAGFHLLPARVLPHTHCIPGMEGSAWVQLERHSRHVAAALGRPCIW